MFLIDIETIPDPDNSRLFQALEMLINEDDVYEDDNENTGKVTAKV